MSRVIHIRNSTGAAHEVYIGRAGHGHDGYYGNPVAIGRPCPRCNMIHHDGGSTLPCYEALLLARLRRDVVFRQRVKALHDRTLVCFCKPDPCHGDVLSQYAARLHAEATAPSKCARAAPGPP